MEKINEDALMKALNTRKAVKPGPVQPVSVPVQAPSELAYLQKRRREKKTRKMKARQAERRH